MQLFSCSSWSDRRGRDVCGVTKRKERVLNFTYEMTSHVFFCLADGWTGGLEEKSSLILAAYLACFSLPWRFALALLGLACFLPLLSTSCSLAGSPGRAAACPLGPRPRGGWGAGQRGWRFALLLECLLLSPRSRVCMACDDADLSLCWPERS